MKYNTRYNIKLKQTAAYNAMQHNNTIANEIIIQVLFREIDTWSILRKLESFVRLIVNIPNSIGIREGCRNYQSIIERRSRSFPANTLRSPTSLLISLSVHSVRVRGILKKRGRDWIFAKRGHFVAHFVQKAQTQAISFTGHRSDFNGWLHARLNYWTLLWHCEFGSRCPDKDNIYQKFSGISRARYLRFLTLMKSSLIELSTRNEHEISPRFHRDNR